MLIVRSFAYLSENNSRFDDNAFLQLMYDIGKTILDPNRWKVCETSAPYYWCNDMNFADRVGNAGAKQGSSKECIHYRSNDFLIYSIDQESYWRVE
jgi:hypothetical protein